MKLHLPPRTLRSNHSQPQHNPLSPSLPHWGSTPRAIALLPLLLSPLLGSCDLASQLTHLSNRNLPSQAQAQEAEKGDSAAAPSTSPTQARSEAIAVKPTNATPPTSEEQSTEEAQPTESNEVAANPTPPAAPATPPRMSLAASTAQTPNSNVIAPPSDDPEVESLSGALRVGNQTDHPLRVAFLAQGHVNPGEASDPPATAPPLASNAADSENTTDPASLAEANAALRDPFHWDFAPGEGGRDGLLLALPQGDLALKTGDVVVAFAQDGSQRYWGPYVVGQTPLPHWNGDREEWQLLVQP